MITYDEMNTCAAITFAAAVEDMAAETCRPIEDVRKELIESKAYESLLNFDSGLWASGPDYFREFYQELEEIP